MAGLLASPRRRRRLAWIAGTLAVIGGAAAVGVVWSNTGTRLETTPFSSRPAAVAETPPSVPYTGSRRTAAEKTAALFIDEAVGRRKLAHSWQLVDPVLKQGLTLAQWKTGNIPVVPYAASSARYLPTYSYENKLLLGVVLFPKKGSGLRPTQFDMELRAHGTGASRRWLVSSWVPHGSAPDPAAAPTATPSGPAPAATVRRVKAPLAVAWLAVPIGIFGLGIAVLAAFGLRGWLRNRRAIRAYRSA